jgi:hypothetical protein
MLWNESLKCFHCCGGMSAKNISNHMAELQNKIGHYFPSLTLNHQFSLRTLLATV